MTPFHDEDDELRDWEIEPEEEKGDRHPALSGTAPLARVVFLALVGAFVLAGVVALINGIGAWLQS